VAHHREEPSTGLLNRLEEQGMCVTTVRREVNLRHLYYERSRCITGGDKMKSNEGRKFATFTATDLGLKQHCIDILS
jgi:hypothetical protein